MSGSIRPHLRLSGYIRKSSRPTLPYVRQRMEQTAEQHLRRLRHWNLSAVHETGVARGQEETVLYGWQLQAPTIAPRG